MQPGLLLLDEPTSQLDVQGKLELIAILSDLKRQGHTLIMAEHDPRPFSSLIDRYLKLERGRLVGEAASLPEPGQYQAKNILMPQSAALYGDLSIINVQGLDMLPGNRSSPETGAFAGAARGTGAPVRPQRGGEVEPAALPGRPGAPRFWDGEAGRHGQPYGVEQGLWPGVRISAQIVLFYIPDAVFLRTTRAVDAMSGLRRVIPYRLSFLVCALAAAAGRADPKGEGMPDPSPPGRRCPEGADEGVAMECIRNRTPPPLR